MRNIRPVQMCLLQLWLATVGIVLFSFWVSHDTMHREDWATMLAILAWVTVVIYHYALHILPRKEERNYRRRRYAGVKARRA